MNDVWSINEDHRYIAIIRINDMGILHGHYGDAGSAFSGYEPEDDQSLLQRFPAGYFCLSGRAENGKRNISVNTLRRIAKALETTPWKILKDAVKFY